MMGPVSVLNTVIVSTNSPVMEEWSAYCDPEDELAGADVDVDVAVLVEAVVVELATSDSLTYA